MNFTTPSWDKQKLSIFFVSLFSIASLFSSCEKELNPTGMSAIPESDLLKVHYDSSFPFKAQVLEDEEYRGVTNDLHFISHICGAVDFPNLSKINSYALFSFFSKSDTIATQSFQGPYTFTFDFTISDIYGTANKAIIDTLFIYELAKYPEFEGINSLKEDQVFVDSDPIMEIFEVFEKDSSYSFELPKSFAERVVSKVMSHLDTISSVADFNKLISEAFKGFVIKKGQNTQTALNLINVSVQWKSADDSFKLGTSSFAEDDENLFSPSITVFERTISEELSNMLAKDTNIAYVISGKSIKSKILIDSLNFLKDSNRFVISQASIVLEAEQEKDFALPIRLQLNIKANGETYSVLATGDEGKYTFNIYQFIHDYYMLSTFDLESDENIEITLVAPYNYSYVKMAKFDFNKNKPRLLVGYTKY